MWPPSGHHALGLLLDLSRDHKYPKSHPDQVAELSARADLPETLARERPLGPEQATDWLGVCRVEFEWMRRLGWIEPVSYGRVQFDGHVDDLSAAAPRHRLAALRTLSKGQRSPARRSVHRTGGSFVLTGCGSLG